MERLFSIGHSTQPVEAFIGHLQACGVATLADIRTMPRSRHNPQFNTDSLAQALKQAGMGYAWLKALGGLRHPRPDSPNTGLRHTSFRGYGDYMQTPEFEAALEALLALPGPVAMMCAESVPWRCHRSLVADALTARGVPVWHIMPDGHTQPHRLTDVAVVSNGHVSYPPQALPLFDEKSGR